MTPFIGLDGLSFSRSRKDILKNISLDISKGKVLAVLGPNGAGKSTLLELILDDFKPTSGKLNYQFNKNKYFKKHVGVVYNNQSIFPILNVSEILDYYKGIYKSDGKYMYELVKEFDLEKLLNSKVRELSEGEKKKLALVLAIFHKPEFLVLDEPFSNVDVTIVQSIWKAIKRQKATVILATHDWNFAEKYADEVLFLKEGEMLCPKFSPEEKAKILSADQKIVTQVNDKLLGTLNKGEFYEKDGHLNVLMTPNVNIQKIKKTTFNYSILDVTVKDVFYYLSLQKS